MGMNDDVLYAEVSILAGGDYLCRYAYAQWILRLLRKKGGFGSRNYQSLHNILEFQPESI